jgi:hypothetical protein
MKKIISRLTIRFVKHLFIDAIAKNDVNLYVDRYGQYWMANSKFSFRTKYTHY